MIKFFRKIRQRLLTERRLGKYLLYAVGEIILVVIGILIALQLNVYKEDFETNSIRKDYYSQLLDDLKKDKVYLEEKILISASLKDNYKAYLETFKNKDLTVDQMYKNIVQLGVSAPSISFNSRTIESLEKSGDIKMIPKDIRNNLIDLKREQDLLTEKVTNNSDAQVDILKEFMLLVGTPDLSERISLHPNIEDFLNPEINFAKAFIALEANMRWKVNTDKSKDYKILKSKIDELVALINTELSH